MVCQPLQLPEKFVYYRNVTRPSAVLERVWAKETTTKLLHSSDLVVSEGFVQKQLKPKTFHGYKSQCFEPTLLSQLCSCSSKPSKSYNFHNLECAHEVLTVVHTIRILNLCI